MKPSYYRDKWICLRKTDVETNTISNLARQIADSFMDHYYQDGHYEKGYIDLLCEMATYFQQEELNNAVSSVFFSAIVEELCDDYADYQFETYNRVMSQVISYCRGLGSGRKLDQNLKKFNLVSEEGILERANRIHAEISPFKVGEKEVRRIFILSRITIGADVAIVSVIMQRLALLFPSAEIIILGGTKLKEIFGGNPRLRIREVSYARRGGLLERLMSWENALNILAEEGGTERPDITLLIDPESRISQLGILPMVEGNNYLYFNSHSNQLCTENAHMAELANTWMDKVFGHTNFCYPKVWLNPTLLSGARKIRDLLDKSGCGKITVVNFGVGGNPRKRIGLTFEKKLISEILKEPNNVVILDKGSGVKETANTQKIIAQLMNEGHQVCCAGPGYSEMSGMAHGVLAVESTIGEIAALISMSDEFIGYDSACQHISASLAIPTITIFAGSNNPRFIRRWSACGNTSCKIIHVNTLTNPQDIDPERIIVRIMEERTQLTSRLPVQNVRIAEIKTPHGTPTKSRKIPRN